MGACGASCVVSTIAFEAFETPILGVVFAVIFALPIVPLWLKVKGAGGKVLALLSAVFMVACAVSAFMGFQRQEELAELAAKREEILAESEQAAAKAEARKDEQHQAFLANRLPEVLKLGTSLLASARKATQAEDYALAVAKLKEARRQLDEVKELKDVPKPLADAEEGFRRMAGQLEPYRLGVEAIAAAEAAIGERHVDAIEAERAYKTALSKLDKVQDFAAKKLGKAKISSLKNQLRRLSKKVEGKAARLRREQADLEEYMGECGDPPPLGAWDAELVGSERYMKQYAHEPRSVDIEACSAPRITEKRCWMTTCRMRAKNAFGAKALSQVTFYVGAGKILGHEVH